MPLTFTKYFHMNPKENSGISPIAHSPAKPGNCCFSKIGKMFRAGWLRTASSAPVHLWPLCLWATVFQRRQPYRSMGSPFNLNIGFFLCCGKRPQKKEQFWKMIFAIFVFFLERANVSIMLFIVVRLPDDSSNIFFIEILSWATSVAILPRTPRVFWTTGAGDGWRPASWWFRAVCLTGESQKTVI